MGTNESRAAVDRIVDAYNAKDLEALSALYHPDATYCLMSGCGERW